MQSSKKIIRSKSTCYLKHKISLEKDISKKWKIFEDWKILEFSNHKNIFGFSVLRKENFWMKNTKLKKRKILLWNIFKQI